MFILGYSVLFLSSDSVVVDVGYAQYQGVFDTNTNVTNFWGIRYAAPPTGELRFRAPQPPANVDGVQSADTKPPECIQGFTTDSEDCLFLNVVIPGNSITQKLFFTRSGMDSRRRGAYVSGNASMYPGSDLLQEANNEVIAVLIQYRLGLFGFLAGNDVKENGDLNAGLLDQHFALRWVNTYISKFGGDPEKVTIWGESAGAGSVIQHIVAQDGKTSPPLFRGAMTSSTFLPSQYPFNDSVPEGIYTEVLSQTNCSSASDTLACLRASDIDTLSTANTNVEAGGFSGTFVFSPVIDGSFITQRPTVALKEGKINGNAYLAVTNTNEGVLFVDATGVIMNTSIYAGELFPKFGAAQDAEVAQQYTGLGTTLDQIIAIMGDSIFKCPSYYILDAFHQQNFSAFKGEFAIPPAIHGLDVPYYFPTTSRTSNDVPNKTFTAAFSQSFLSFVVSLDPNDKIDPSDDITPPWTVYSIEQTEMVFNKTVDNQTDIQTIMTDPAFLERCRFWESVGELTGQ
ncbi:alpha/beta-hydrolase [Gymnopus androsaceus JB14]|uniref:Carboxylic ester hydrolase n=1 Tax=Gymnopus androsaceus JB14 TaxID=1447944 RepID=A0A6A4IG21_9AGAR|nr:alpha/beta-hydrolase [Gymnopus androsaceus JB14]